MHCEKWNANMEHYFHYSVFFISCKALFDCLIRIDSSWKCLRSSAVIKISFQPAYVHNQFICLLVKNTHWSAVHFHFFLFFFCSGIGLFGFWLASNDRCLIRSELFKRWPMLQLLDANISTLCYIERCLYLLTNCRPSCSC